MCRTLTSCLTELHLKAQQQRSGSVGRGQRRERRDQSLSGRRLWRQLRVASEMTGAGPWAGPTPVGEGDWCWGRGGESRADDAQAEPLLPGSAGRCRCRTLRRSRESAAAAMSHQTGIQGNGATGQGILRGGGPEPWRPGRLWSGSGCDCPDRVPGGPPPRNRQWVRVSRAVWIGTGPGRGRPGPA